MDNISESNLLERFDELVAEGVIIYGPHTKRPVEAEGYPMEFRICPALATKPHTIGATNSAFNHTRKWGPGSDMYCPDERLILTQLNGTHDLAFNLFCVDRPQLLMLTLDSYKRQHEPLEEDDFKAVLEVLKTWKGWYIIFNCGEKGGCSRIHKHLQGLRGPPRAFHALLSKDDDARVPFKYFMHRFEKGFAATSIAEILQKYNELLELCRGVLELGKDEFVPHNVILWDDWITLLPRRKGIWEGASANTGGMMGSVWVPDESEVNKWIQLGCANVLRELGVPL